MPRMLQRYAKILPPEAVIRYSMNIIAKLNRIMICTIALVIFGTVLFAVPAEAADGYPGRVEVSALYVRKGPGTEYDNICVGADRVKLKMEQKVTVYGKVGNWYHISVNYSGQNIEGYSMGTQDGFDWISLETKVKLPVEIFVPAVINAGTLNVRKGPSITADKAKVGNDNVLLQRDHKLTIIGTADDEDGDPWYHVMTEFNGQLVFGYSLAKYIKPDDGTNKDTSGSQSGSGQGTSQGGTKPSPTPTQGPTPKPTPVVPQSDYTDGVVTKKVESDDSLKALGLSYDPSEVVPMGYELVGRSYSSNLNIPARVTANLLNLREIQSMEGEVIAVLKKDAELVVLNAFLEDTEDSAVKYRWFKVLTMVDNTYMLGCVRGDFIELDYSNPISVSTKYAEQMIWLAPEAKADKLAIGGAVVKLSKGLVLSMVGEKKDASGTKWYHVKGKFGTVQIDGYIQSYRVNFTKIANAFEVFSLTKSTGAGTGMMVAPGTLPVAHTIAGADVVIRDATGLALHEKAGFTSPIRMTSKSQPALVYAGDNVKLLTVETIDGVAWSQIRCSYMGEELEGWIRSTYVGTGSSIQQTSGGAYLSSSSFESMLTQQGFPESYKTLLRALHEQYPKWEFRAYKTGLDWNDVIKAESAVGANLVPNSKENEWKSFEKGAYNWATDSFIAYDGSTWVTASKEAVAYYMDPRNFLSSSAIFQFELLSYNTAYQDVEGIENILRNTALSKASYSYVDDEGYARTVTFAETILMAAEYTGVSPFHLASRIKQEIVSGTNSVSNSVSGTVSGYEGLYNYYNIGAYNSTAAGGAIKNGLRFAKTGSSSASLNLSCLIPWDNRFRSIVGGGYYIGNSYVNKGQNTIYLEKFNVTGTNTYGHQYMSNLEAPYSEGKRVASGYDDPGALPIVFSIPVYENMPATPAPLPKEQKNPNNWLKTLKIIDGDGNTIALSPAFDPEKLEYSITVNEAASFIRFKTTTVSSLAHVTSLPIIPLEKGKSKFVVCVTAENGQDREYVININCK